MTGSVPASSSATHPSLPTLPDELYRRPIPSRDCELVLRKVHPNTDSGELLRLINWAYRGKPGVKQWTGESHLIKSPRMTKDTLAELMHHVQEAPQNLVFIVAVKQFYRAEPPAKEAGTDTDRCMLADNTQLVGCVKVERLVPLQHLTHDGRDEYRQKLGALGTACELGLVTSDPSETGQQIGRTLMEYAQYHALQHMQCTEMFLWVVSSRSELITMYEKLGFADTGDRNKFQVPGIVWHDGVDSSNVYFAILQKTLTADDTLMSQFAGSSAGHAASASPPPAAVAPTGTEQLRHVTGNGATSNIANGSQQAPAPPAANEMLSKAGKQENQAVLSVSIDSIPTEIIITKFSNLYHVIITQSARGIVGTWIHAQCDQASALVDMNTVSYELQALLGDKNNATIHLVARRLIQVITEQHVLSLDEQQVYGSDLPSLLLTCALQRRKDNTPAANTDYADADMALAKTIVHVIESAGIIKQQKHSDIIDE